MCAPVRLAGQAWENIRRRWPDFASPSGILQKMGLACNDFSQRRRRHWRGYCFQSASDSINFKEQAAHESP
jgi:hypothetical protein